MSCAQGIVKSIISNCTTQGVGGLEVIAYLFNRGAMSITYDPTYPNKVTGITSVDGALMYRFEGVKSNLNAGHERVITEDLADTYKHKGKLTGFEFDTESVANLDGLNDFCLIVEYKKKIDSGDGVFVGYGFQSGLYITADTRMAIENNANRPVEFATRDQEGEPCSQYNVLITDAATTESTLINLLS